MKVIDVSKTQVFSFYIEYGTESYFLQCVKIKPSGDYCVPIQAFDCNLNNHRTHHERTETYHVRIDNKNKSVQGTQLYPVKGKQIIISDYCDDFKSSSILKERKMLFYITPFEFKRAPKHDEKIITINLDKKFKLKDVQVYAELVPSSKLHSFLECAKTKQIISNCKYDLDDNVSICVKVITDLI